MAQLPRPNPVPNPVLKTSPQVRAQPAPSALLGSAGLGRAKRVSLQRQIVVNAGLWAMVGLGCITGSAAWQMYRQLVGIHKQSLEAIAQAFPTQLEARLGTAPAPASTLPDTTPEAAASGKLAESIQQVLAQVAAAGLAGEDVMIWVGDGQGRLLAQSKPAAQDALSTRDLAMLTGGQDLARLRRWGDRSLLVCRSSIKLPSLNRSPTASPEWLYLYLAQDVTQERQQITASLWQLFWADLLVTLVLVGAIAQIVHRGLAPLARINHLAQELSASDLGQARLGEDQAPEEVAALVEGFNAMLERLAEAWQKQRQFVNDASHELRTPPGDRRWLFAKSAAPSQQPLPIPARSHQHRCGGDPANDSDAPGHVDNGAGGQWPTLL